MESTLGIIVMEQDGRENRSPHLIKATLAEKAVSVGERCEQGSESSSRRTRERFPGTFQSTFQGLKAGHRGDGSECCCLHYRLLL